MSGGVPRATITKNSNPVQICIACVEGDVCHTTHTHYQMVDDADAAPRRPDDTRERLLAEMMKKKALVCGFIDRKSIKICNLITFTS